MRFQRAIASVFMTMLCGSGLFGQPPQADPRLVGERVILVVPMVGTGSAKDPMRPLYVPTPEVRGASDLKVRPALPEKSPKTNDDGVFAWRYEVSTDGKTALLEITGRDQASLAQFKKNQRPDVKVFDVGKATKEEIQTEFRKYKADFDADKFADGPIKGSGVAVGVKP